MSNKTKLTKKNHIRRFGKTCINCDKKLGEFRLDGKINGESLSFCSFKCHDDYLAKAANK